MEEKKNFGFIASRMDGTEHVFSAPAPSFLPESYSYKRFLPPVVDQGADSICVPCSISAYLNWRENMQTGSRKDNKVNYYELYRSKDTSGDGMTFKCAFRYLRHHGVSSKYGELKIKEYALIGSSISLKIAILMNGPCLGALPVYNDGPEFWKKRDGDVISGYHAIAIVGYDTEGFIIRNSWGKDFGKDGYSTLKYEDTKELIEMWTIID